MDSTLVYFYQGSISYKKKDLSQKFHELCPFVKFHSTATKIFKKCLFHDVLKDVHTKNENFSRLLLTFWENFNMVNLSIEQTKVNNIKIQNIQKTFVLWCFEMCNLINASSPKMKTFSADLKTAS